MKTFRRGMRVSGGQGGVGLELIHDDLAVHPRDRRMRQKDLVDQPVQVGQAGAKDPQQAIGIAGQCPGADDLGLGRDEAKEGGRRLGVVPRHLHLQECLHRKPQPLRVKLCMISCNQTKLFKPLAAATGLACRQVQDLAQILCRKMRVALQRRQEPLVGIVEGCGEFLHEFSE